MFIHFISGADGSEEELEGMEMICSEEAGQSNLCANAGNLCHDVPNVAMKLAI